MTTNLTNFTRAIYVFDAVVRRVPDDSWDFDSPCDEWSARDVLRHHCGVLDAMTATLKTGETVPPSMAAEADQPVDRWGQARDAVLEALDQPDVLNHEGTFWFGPMSVDKWIQIVQWDSLAHAWDIGKAVAIDPELPSDLCEISAAIIGAMHETALKWKLVKAPVAVPDGSSEPDKFLALIGRNPN